MMIRLWDSFVVLCVAMMGALALYRWQRAEYGWMAFANAGRRRRARGGRLMCWS